MHVVTHDELIERLSYDAETGIFTSLTKRIRRKIGDPVGLTKADDGYVQVFLLGRKYYAHRLAWFYMTKQWPSGQVDHRNGIHGDNRFCNLRDCTHSENHENLARFLSDGQLRGGHKCGDYYRATITKNGKSIYLGKYRTKEEAHAAYLKGKARIHVFNPEPRD